MQRTPDSPNRGAVITFACVAAFGCARTSQTPPPSSPPTAVAQPAAAPTPTPTPDAVDPTCAAMRTRIEDDLCGDDPDCEVTDLPCTQQLDLDGDGKLDDVGFAEVEGQPVFRVTFGHGETAVLTEPFELTEVPDLGQSWPPPSEERYPSEVSWLVAWKVAKREGDELVLRSRFRAGPAVGDGLWLSGTDAAAMLVLTERGWLLVELGY